MSKTLTIGIPAHNEARGIEKMLLSTLDQKRTRYHLDRIIVACDGCTDDTVDIVRKLMKEYPEIEIIDDGKRMGQIGRLNEFYKLCESDIFLTLDADVVLEGASVIDSVVDAFSDDSIGLVGGEGAPRPPKFFWEKVFVAWIEVWTEIRRGLNDGDNIHNHQGCISAMSRGMYTQTIIPREAISNDEYLYFRAIELGYRFAYAGDAVVRYICPTTLRDNLKQSARFISTKYGMQRFFSFDIVPYYTVPLRVKCAGIGRSFLRKPILVSAAALSQVLLRVGTRLFEDRYKNGVWEQVQTSK